MRLLISLLAAAGALLAVLGGTGPTWP